MAKPEKKGPRKVRVEFRRNRAPRTRLKDWKRDVEQGQGEPEGPLEERIAAKGELSRRRTVDAPGEHPPSEGVDGTVIAVRGLISDVHDGSQTWPCTVRRVLRTRKIEEHNPVVVGDRVRFTPADREGVEREGVIEWIAPRRGALKRRVGRSDQVVVANVDQVIIVTSADEPPPKPHLIDRYIIATHAGDAVPVICINKMDLDSQGAADAVAGIYEPLDYRVVKTSAATGSGVEELREVLADRRSVVAGQSGVGKSSLLNAVQPGLQLRVGDIIEQLQKGRHTTTTAQLLPLGSGGYVVDTPGIRSFDIATVPLAELEAYFVEFVDCVAGCKFPDCTHTHEPKCAIKAAVESGEIHPGRYESYVRMVEERQG